MITYKWTCDSVNCSPEIDGLQNVILNVVWKLEGVCDEVKDNGDNYSSDISGIQEMPAIKDTSNFIEFETLTSEQVLSWVKAGIGEQVIKSMEDNISDIIQESKIPVVENVRLTLL
tara:strand:+ start:462 stop:809 length:348 start_codon:yes stop_codon:yes gene_type:complete